MTRNTQKTEQRQHEWDNDPKVLAFRQRLARAEQFAESIAEENMTGALVDRFAAEINALTNEEILNTRQGYEEFTSEINRLDETLAFLDHEIAQKRRNRNA